jgi:hypothetical protein
MDLVISVQISVMQKLCYHYSLKSNLLLNQAYHIYIFLAIKLMCIICGTHFDFLYLRVSTVKLIVILVTLSADTRLV